MNDERLELLLAISNRTLGIESFELTGRQTLDFHVVNAFGVATVPEWASLFNYLVMVLTLIFKPEGLFAPRRVRKV